MIAFYVLTKMAFIQKQFLLTYSEICHHGNLLNLEGWENVGKCATSGILIPLGYDLLCFSF